jgi:cyclase
MINQVKMAFLIGAPRIKCCLLATVVFAVVVTPLYGDSASTKERTVTKIADGIYEIRHADAPGNFPSGVQGNTTVIIGGKAVLVVDSGRLPSTARQDIEQIKTWTNKPVTYLVNTHFHYDHTLGNEAYAAAFPAIQIVAQRQTQKLIGNDNPGQLARFVNKAAEMKKQLDSGKNPEGTPLTASDRKKNEQTLADMEPVLEEIQGVSQLVPNVSFDTELDVDLGNRPVEIKFLGKGNTFGDTIVYLPKDKVLVAGDLVDHPVPYFFGFCFPVSLIQTLQKLAQLDAQVIVPGHGDVLHDKSYIAQMMDLATTVNTEVARLVNDGKTLEEIQPIVSKLPQLPEWRQKFAGDNPEDRTFFDQSFAALIKASQREIYAGCIVTPESCDE